MENIAFPEVIGSYRKAGGRMAELRKKKAESQLSIRTQNA